MPKNKTGMMHKMPNGKMMPNKAMKPMMAGKTPAGAKPKGKKGK